MSILSRPFHGPEDLELLKRFVMDIWPDKQSPSYFHLGDLLWFMYQNTLFDPLRNIRIWQTIDGTVAGFAVFHIGKTDFSVNVQVHPIYHENIALYEDMLQWLDKRVADECKKYSVQKTISTIAYENDVVLQAALLRYGYVAGDIGMLHFSRPLDSLVPEPILPPGWEVRHVGNEKEWKERVDIHRDVWYPSRVTLEAYKSLRTVDGYIPQLDLVAVTPDGTFASYCICWLDPLNHCGEFEPVGTRAAFRRQGIGKALIQEGLRRLFLSGATSAIVYTYDNNIAARRLYESVGFRVVMMERDYSKRLEQ